MLIAWRDYIQDGFLDEGASNDFEPTLPFTNAQDRDLSSLAQGIPASAGNFAVTINLDAGPAGRKIGLVAILNHNFASIGQGDVSVEVQLLNPVGAYIASVNMTPVWLPAADSLFTKHLYFVFDQNYSGVGYVVFGIARAGLTPFLAAPSFGRMWASPYFAPTYKTSHNDFNIKVMDDSTGDKSRGKQFYDDPQPRYRRMHVSTILTEDEAIGTDDGLTVNMQDIAFEVGRTGAAIVIASTATSQVIHKFGVYGHFESGPPDVTLTDTNKKLGRLYSSVFEIDEDL